MYFNFTIYNKDYSSDPYNLQDFYDSYVYTVLGVIIINFIVEQMM